MTVTQHHIIYQQIAVVTRHAMLCSSATSSIPSLEARCFDRLYSIE